MSIADDLLKQGSHPSAHFQSPHRKQEGMSETGYDAYSEYLGGGPTATAYDYEGRKTGNSALFTSNRGSTSFTWDDDKTPEEIISLLTYELKALSQLMDSEMQRIYSKIGIRKVR